MPATTDSCERSWSLSRPRRTAPRNLSRLTSRVERIESAQSSISRGGSRGSRRRALANGLLAAFPENPVTLALRLGQHLLPLLDDPARLLDLLGDRGAHLVEDVVDLLAVDAHLIGQED